mmetsp:Transcript_48672/g.110679  ORF Transcript_48672/g.110679 Transcript_48672/m.110679 type:complete len:369 (-) Transcript_48672:50-1156(-)
MVVQQLFQGRKSVPDPSWIIGNKRWWNVRNANAFNSGVQSDAGKSISTLCRSRGPNTHTVSSGLHPVSCHFCRRWGFILWGVSRRNNIAETFFSRSQHLQHSHLRNRNLFYHRLLLIVAVLRPGGPPHRPGQGDLDVGVSVVKQVAIQQCILLKSGLDMKRIPIDNKTLGVDLIFVQEQPPACLCDHPGDVSRIGHYGRKSNILSLRFIRHHQILQGVHRTVRLQRRSWKQGRPDLICCPIPFVKGPSKDSSREVAAGHCAGLVGGHEGHRLRGGWGGHRGHGRPRRRYPGAPQHGMRKRLRQRPVRMRPSGRLHSRAFIQALPRNLGQGVHGAPLDGALGEGIHSGRHNHPDASPVSLRPIRECIHC